MSRLVDRGAVVAAYVGIGVAVTVGVSFLLVIPIEIVFLLLGLPSGLLIGYYANSRAERDGGPLGRIVANGAFAAAVTAATMALLYVGVKGLFFVGDNGYRDASLGAPLACESGAGCVYARYAADPELGPQLAAAGVDDVASFTDFYWAAQLSNAGTVLGLTLAGGIAGALVFAVARRRPA
ncbi:MAG: hypothetical protein RL338_1708 [Chloroflexota bacterium]